MIAIFQDIQRVQIVESVDHGRMLVLDGFVNIAESDTEAYTHKLMGLPEVSINHTVVMLI